VQTGCGHKLEQQFTCKAYKRETFGSPHTVLQIRTLAITSGTEPFFRTCQFCSF
jgi:hypothetical protein